MINRSFISCAALVLLVAGAGCSAKKPDVPYSVQYPGPWADDPDLGISRALVKADAHGCGEFVYRWHTDHKSALVYCSGDGKAFQTAYIVWPSSELSVGPSPLLGDVPPPAASEN